MKERILPISLIVSSVTVWNVQETFAWAMLITFYYVTRVMENYYPKVNENCTRKPCKNNKKYLWILPNMGREENITIKNKWIYLVKINHKRQFYILHKFH